MKRGVVIQVVSTLILTLSNAMASFSVVWPSYAIGVLKSDISPLGFKITQNDANLISAIPMLGSFVSTLGAGFVAESFGRKKSLILCVLTNIVSWSLLLTSRSVLQVILGRFIVGLGSGMAVVLFFITISETTQLSIRATAASSGVLIYNVGTIASYLEGWFFSYDAICYVNLTFSVINVMLLSWLRETPPHLLKIGQEKEALKSLKFYRGESTTTDAILEELSYMKSQIKKGANNDSVKEELVQTEKEELKKEANNVVDENSTNKNPWILLCVFCGGVWVLRSNREDAAKESSTLLSPLGPEPLKMSTAVIDETSVTIPHYRRTLANSVMFMALSVGMGMVAVQTNASRFFGAAAPNLSAHVCSVLLGAVIALSSVLTVAVTDMVSRRLLMISASAVTTISLVTLGALMRWPLAPAWVAPLVIMLYSSAYNMGVINVVFVQLSESFGPQVNSAATAIVFATMFAASFVILYVFAPAAEFFGIGGILFIFASIAATSTVMSIFFLQETRRVPLEDIHKMHANGFMYRRVKDTEK